MNVTKFIPSGVALKASRALLQLQKSSPTTLFVAGAVGVVATAVLAGQATLKAQHYMDEIAPIGDEPQEISVKSKVQVAGTIAKIYAPTVAVGALTIGALTGSHRILTTRNTSLAAAYVTLSDAYDKYQARVVEELGEDKEKTIRQDLIKRSFEEDGKTVKYKTVGNRQVSPYGRFFDETCSSWSKNAQSNLLFLTCQQNWLNDRLQSRGHVFLNEVYDALGFERTSAGSVTGWLSKGEGDGYIDFGIHNADNPEARAFVNGHERSIFVDFNVDGLIYQLIEK